MVNPTITVVLVLSDKEMIEKIVEILKK